MTSCPDLAFPEDLLLELPELIEACVNGTATAEQISSLDHRMATDPQACKLYARYMHTLCALRTWSEYQMVEQEGSDFASASVTRLSDSLEKRNDARVVPAFSLPGAFNYLSSGWPMAYLIATLVVSVGIAIAAVTHVSRPIQVVGPSTLPSHLSPAVPPLPSSKIVGRITGMADCKWLAGQ